MQAVAGQMRAAKMSYLHRHHPIQSCCNHWAKSQTSFPGLAAVDTSACKLEINEVKEQIKCLANILVAQGWVGNQVVDSPAVVVVDNLVVAAADNNLVEVADTLLHNIGWGSSSCTMYREHLSAGRMRATISQRLRTA